jgi:hypothetical protein
MKKLPKAQLGALIKAFSKVAKPVAKVVKPVAKKIKPAVTAKMKARALDKETATWVKKYNSETNPFRLAERKTMKELMKEWEKAAKSKYPNGDPVFKSIKNKKIIKNKP